MLGEDSSTSSVVTDAQIVAWLNEAQRKLCWEGTILMTAAVASTVASQEQYSLPSDYLRMEAVFLYQNPGTQWRLVPIRVVQRHPAKMTGTPARYFIWGINVSGQNSYYVGLNPIPDTSGTNDIEIYYRQLPLTMVSGGQGPEIPTEWQDALPVYALWHIYRRLGREWQALASDAHMEWEDWVKRARSYVNPLQTDSPTQVTDTGYLQIWE